MLNLLSTEEKKKVLNEYRLRLAVIVTLAVGVLVLASFELLIPSYVLASLKYSNAQKNIVVLEEKYGSNAKEKELAEQVRNINMKVATLTDTTADTRLLFSQIIANALKVKGDEIKITGFRYDASSAQERISVSGTARYRDSLAAFVDALKKDTTYSSVTFPISSYVKSEDISFSVILDRKAVNTKKK